MRNEVDKVGGIGKNKKVANFVGEDKNKDGLDLNKLSGCGLEDLKYLDKRNKLALLNLLKDKIELAKQDNHDKKK